MSVGGVPGALQIRRGQFVRHAVYQPLSTPMQIISVLLVLQRHETLRDITVDQLITFLNLCSLLKRDIFLPQPHSHSANQAPFVLPPSISAFLSKSTRIPLEHMHDCWTILRDIAWDFLAPTQRYESALESFRLHGWKYGLSK